MKKYFVLTAVLVISAMGCASAGSSTPKTGTSQAQTIQRKELKNTSWKLTEISNERVNLMDDAEITLNFETTNFYGKAAINNYFGNFTQHGKDGISFGAVASTKMAGPAEMMNLETKFLDLLEKATSFSVDSSGNLVLVSGSEKLIFSRVK